MAGECVTSMLAVALQNSTHVAHIVDETISILGQFYERCAGHQQSLTWLMLTRVLLVLGWAFPIESMLRFLSVVRKSLLVGR